MPLLLLDISKTVKTELERNIVFPTIFVQKKKIYIYIYTHASIVIYRTELDVHLKTIIRMSYCKVFIYIKF
jgi:hypothetical protein